MLETVVAPVTVAILIIAFTPLGKQLQDIIFPRPTFVEGVVLIKEMNNKPVPDVRVVVLEDNKLNGTTNDKGKFYILNMPNGKLYNYRVVDEGNDPVYGPDWFYFPLTEELLKLEIDVGNTTQNNVSSMIKENLGTKAFVPSKTQADYQIALRAEGTFIPKQLRQPGLESNTHKITVLVEANPQTLSQIERVTYYLDPTFSPSFVRHILLKTTLLNRSQHGGSLT